jgi:hypothetical protein
VRHRDEAEVLSVNEMFKNTWILRWGEDCAERDGGGVMIWGKSGVMHGLGYGTGLVWMHAWKEG